MEREEFKVLVKAMKAVYPQPTFIPDQDAFNVWYGLLKDLQYNQLSMAIQKYMLTEKYPPTIADLRTKTCEIMDPDLESMSELEAWAIVRKAIRNSGYQAKEEFEKLPLACKMAVGSPSNLREWAMMDSEQIGTVQQSHFIKSYRSAVAKIKEDRKIPDSIKKSIEKKREEKAIAESERKKADESERKDQNNPGTKEDEGYVMSEETRRKLDAFLGRR